MNVARLTLLHLAVCFVPLRSEALNHYYDYFPIQPFFSCNDLIHVSLDESCQVLITPAQMLEGEVSNLQEFEVELINDLGVSIPNPATKALIGKTITVKVIHTPTGNNCWGKALIEDKSKPTIFCSNANIPCFQDLTMFQLPTAMDNCTVNPSVVLTNQVVDASDRCNGVVITKTFVAIDGQGNVSLPCTQVLTTIPPPLPSFPKDITWPCEVYEQHQNVISPTKLTVNLDTTGSGVPDVALGPYCPYTVTSSDIRTQGCGNTFSIVRTWSVVNWCTGQLVLVDINGDDNVQFIKVVDKSPPSLTLAPYTVSINSTAQNHLSCLSTGFLPPPIISDNCSSWNIRIFTPAGEANYVNGTNGAQGGYIPHPGLPPGTHSITYRAIDICGNIGTLNVNITVVDQTAPVTICEELTSVSLENNGLVTVFASTFDDGTFDNCCLDTFLVRRMENLCTPADTLFKDKVTFCCSDVGREVMVHFRAYDCSTNFNDCMVRVKVEDKIIPSIVSCPGPATIDCNYFDDTLRIALSQEDFSILSRFGTPVFKDNCGLVYLENEVDQDIDQCLRGTITRKWKVSDPSNSGNVSCLQTITVDHVSNWVVQFPNDITVNCTESLPFSGMPEIFFEDCELIAVSYFDEIFSVVPDVCFKIARNWVVINWCQVGDNIEDIVVESSEKILDIDLNNDGAKNLRTFQDGLNVSNFNKLMPLNGANPDGYIRYQQAIKVIDQVKPVVTCVPEINICIIDTECTATFELPRPLVQDCSYDISFNAHGDLGTGLGPFTNVPVGNYNMVYTINDNCGNAAACETKVKVRDCKKPTPFCANGLSVTLEQDTSVTIHAEDFDAGSFDNCAGNLTYSFTPLISTSTLVLDCFSLGFVTVEIWLTDSNGNQDYCTTFVFVDDNNRVCQGAPLISGSIKTAGDIPVPNVKVKFNDSPNAVETNVHGVFTFEAQRGMNYSVCPNRDNSLLNGVTTFDIVLISRHILGLQLLDNPYKIIAADVNNSGAVTTADIVAIRKLILQMTDHFTNNTSWRFIDKSYKFPFPANPFYEVFPELMNINQLFSDYNTADFVAIKIGDVNDSSIP